VTNHTKCAVIFSFCHLFTIERTFHCISFCGARSLASHQSLNFDGANRWEKLPLWAHVEPRGSKNPLYPLAHGEWRCVCQCHTIAPMICHLSERCASAAFNAFICHTFMQFTPLCHAHWVGGGGVMGRKGSGPAVGTEHLLNFVTWSILHFKHKTSQSQCVDKG